MAIQTFTALQVLTAAQQNALQGNDYNQTVSAKTANYVLVASDVGTKITMSSASATTITVNTSLFAAGDTLTILNVGAGVCTVTAGTATVSTTGTLALAQYAGGTLYFTSAGVSVFQADGVAAVSAGLTHIATLTMTAVASGSVNNCFTSTYENYRLIGAFTASSGSGNITMKMRASSSDTSTNYQSQLLQAYSSTVSTALNAEGTDEWYVVSFNTTGKTSGFAMDVYRPQTAQITAMTYSGLFVDGSAVISVQSGVGRQSDATQFDGFTMIWNSTTITGTVRVYGYQNS